MMEHNATEEFHSSMFLLGHHQGHGGIIKITNRQIDFVDARLL